MLSARGARWLRRIGVPDMATMARFAAFARRNILQNVLVLLFFIDVHAISAKAIVMLLQSSPVVCGIKWVES